MSGLQYEIFIDASQIPSAPDSGILIKHSLPLGYHVPDKLKYLKYEVTYMLISPICCHHIRQLLILFCITFNTSLKLSEVKKNKTLSSISQWTNAFDIFMSLCIEKKIQILHYPLSNMQTT